MSESHVIVPRLLEGHKDAVSCIDMSKTCDHILISGSEDKTVRFWDLRLSKPCFKAIVGFFGDGIESVVLSPVLDSIAYCSTSSEIFSFDIRTDNAIVKECISSIPIIETDDELNAFRIHPTGKYAVSTHDSGKITTIPLNMDGSLSRVNQQSITWRVLKDRHSALSSCIAFSPSNPFEIYTGGYDCGANLWDISRGRISRNRKFSGSSNEAQAFNPPFVQALDVYREKNALLVGLGNGVISVVSTLNFEEICSVNAHNGMINSIQVQDDIVISGGIDRTLKFYRLNIDNNPTKKVHNKKNKIDKAVETVVAPNTLDYLGSISHGRKINAICGNWRLLSESLQHQDSMTDNQDLNDHKPTIICDNNISRELQNSLCVADTSCRISVY